MVDMSYAPESSKVKSSGFTLFEGDDEEGEGPIHCHGTFAASFIRTDAIGISISKSSCL